MRAFDANRMTKAPAAGPTPEKFTAQLRPLLATTAEATKTQLAALKKTTEQNHQDTLDALEAMKETITSALEQVTDRTPEPPPAEPKRPRRVTAEITERDHLGRAKTIEFTIN